MEFGLKALERLLVGLGVCSGWFPRAVNDHRCENLIVAACAGFIGFGECMGLALLAICSGHPAGRIEGDFEFLPAPVGLDIQDRIDEIAGCSGFVRSGAEPRSDLNACGIRCGKALDHAVEHDSALMGEGMDRGCDALLGEQKQDAYWHGGHLVERAHAISVSAFRNVEEYGTRGQFPRMEVADLSSPLPPWITGKEP